MKLLLVLQFSDMKNVRAKTSASLQHGHPWAHSRFGEPTAQCWPRVTTGLSPTNNTQSNTNTNMAVFNLKIRFQPEPETRVEQIRTVFHKYTVKHATNLQQTPQPNPSQNEDNLINSFINKTTFWQVFYNSVTFNVYTNHSQPFAEQILKLLNFANYRNYSAYH